MLISMLMACGSVGSGFALDVVGRNAAHAMIVIPDNPIDVEEYAAQELQYHIVESTGVTLASEGE